jgi:hypothetical protein
MGFLIKGGVILVLFLFFLLVLQVALIKGYTYSKPRTFGEKEMAPCLLFDCYKINYVTDANVTEPSYEIGFNPGPDDLRFGELSVGSNSKRFIDISGDGDSDSKVILTSSGDISPYVRFSPNSFILKRNANAKITAEFSTEEGMETKLYEGTISLIKITPKYFFANTLLGLI